MVAMAIKLTLQLKEIPAWKAVSSLMTSGRWSPLVEFWCEWWWGCRMVILLLLCADDLIFCCHGDLLLLLPLRMIGRIGIRFAR
jgi:hypothetical protein